MKLRSNKLRLGTTRFHYRLPKCLAQEFAYRDAKYVAITHTFIFMAYIIMLFVPLRTVSAQDLDIVLPAGALLQCTIDEPNLSPVTAEVDDPVLCRVGGTQQFGHVLPRNAYLAGHLVDNRQPGHFVGKGSMNLKFEVIAFSNSQRMPFEGKVIAVSGYRVDRIGKIIGKGHAKRDAIEWALPVLWPWKLLLLPARGPQPALKGEVQLTLRVMSDVIQAQANTPQLGSFHSSALQNQGDHISPQSTAIIAANSSWQSQLSFSLPQNAAESREKAVRELPPNLTVMVFKTGMVYAVSDYWLLEDGQLAFTSMNHMAARTADLTEVDWNRTNQVNAARGVTIALKQR